MVTGLFASLVLSTFPNEISAFVTSDVFGFKQKQDCVDVLICLFLKNGEIYVS